MERVRANKPHYCFYISLRYLIPYTEGKNGANTSCLWSLQSDSHSLKDTGFDFVGGILQVDTITLYLFIIYPDYVLRTSIDLIKENSFTLKKKKGRRYPAETITDANYADDIALLTITPTQAESQLHNLEQVAGGIGPYVNADKTECMF